MRISEFGADATAAAVRGLAPPARAVEEDVRAIVAAVRDRGDAALLELTAGALLGASGRRGATP